MVSFSDGQAAASLRRVSRAVTAMMVEGPSSARRPAFSRERRASVPAERLDWNGEWNGERRWGGGGGGQGSCVCVCVRAQDAKAPWGERATGQVPPQPTTHTTRGAGDEAAGAPLVISHCVVGCRFIRALGARAGRSPSR